MKCAVCKVELTTTDADHLVKTDAGPVHRECFEGPVPPGSEVDIDELELAAENERRRDHGLPELEVADWKAAGEMLARARIPDYDKADEDMRRLEREDLDNPLDPDLRLR